jgi:hypothetical protein
MKRFRKIDVVFLENADPATHTQIQEASVKHNGFRLKDWVLSSLKHQIVTGCSPKFLEAIHAVGARFHITAVGIGKTESFDKAISSLPEPLRKSALRSQKTHGAEIAFSYMHSA